MDYNSGYMSSSLMTGHHQPPSLSPTTSSPGSMGFGSLGSTSSLYDNNGFGQNGHSYFGSSMSTPSYTQQSAYFNPYLQLQGLAAVAAAGSSPTLARALAAVQQTQKRPRSEKKAFPMEQKDSKYFERRKRNNLAAKKSRDARKSREDEISIRASFLEKENAILRAQVATLREEANSLKQLLLQKRSKH